MQIILPLLADANMAEANQSAEAVEGLATDVTGENGAFFSAMVNVETTSKKSANEQPGSAHEADLKISGWRTPAVGQIKTDDESIARGTKFSGTSTEQFSEKSSSNSSSVRPDVGDAAWQGAGKNMSSDEPSKRAKLDAGITRAPENSKFSDHVAGIGKSPLPVVAWLGTSKQGPAVQSGELSKSQIKSTGEASPPNPANDDAQSMGRMRDTEEAKARPVSQLSQNASSEIADARGAPKLVGVIENETGLKSPLESPDEEMKVEPAQRPKVLEPGTASALSTTSEHPRRHIAPEIGLRAFKPLTLPSSSEVADVRAPRALEALRNVEIHRSTAGSVHVPLANASETAKLALQTVPLDSASAKVGERAIFDLDASLETLNTPKPETLPFAKTIETNRAELQTRSATSQVAHVIQRSAVDGFVELRLQPEELGRVRMTMSQTETGVIVHVAAERAETADLLRRNVDVLAQELRERGLTSSGFTFEQDQNQYGAPSDQEGTPSHAHASDGDTPMLVVDQRTMPSSDGGIDIRI